MIVDMLLLLEDIQIIRGMAAYYWFMIWRKIKKSTNRQTAMLSGYRPLPSMGILLHTLEPTSYFGVVPQKDKMVSEIDHFSFLTFSPDGQYIALSKQGCIAWNNGRNMAWGHQPSCLVSVRKTDSAHEEIVQYEDLSDEGIEGLREAKSVSSVFFSKDNSKLMMVGRDGVVIIRNTHL